MTDKQEITQQKDISHSVIDVIEPRLKVEFETFLKTVENGEIPEHWEILAEALNVHKNTITSWKKTPEFQKALIKGIHRTIKEMERVGRHDWKMWRERLSILTKEKSDTTVNIDAKILVIPTTLIDKYGIKSES